MATYETPGKTENCTYFYPGTKVRLNVINVVRRGILTREEVAVMKKLSVDGDDYALIAAKMGVSTKTVAKNLEDERSFPKSRGYGDSHGDATHDDLFPEDKGLIEE